MMRWVKKAAKGAGKRARALGRRASRAMGIFPLEERRFAFGKFSVVAKRGDTAYVIYVSDLPRVKGAAGLKLPAAAMDKGDAMAREVTATVVRRETEKISEEEVWLVNLTGRDMTIREARKRSHKNNYFLGINEEGKLFLFFTED